MLTNLQFKVSRDCGVFICLTGTVTQEAIQKLIDLLECSKDTYPTRAEIEPAVEAEAAPPEDAPPATGE